MGWKGRKKKGTEVSDLEKSSYGKITVVFPGLGKEDVRLRGEHLLEGVRKAYTKLTGKSAPANVSAFKVLSLSLGDRENMVVEVERVDQ